MFIKLYAKYLLLKEKGQGLVEYAIIVAVVIAAALAILGILNGSFVGLYNKLSAKIAAIVL